jgi:chaperone LolA
VRRLAILVALAIPTAAHAAPTATDVAHQVEQFYAKLSHLHAHFRQDVYSAMWGQTQTSSGTVWLARPTSMRWNYATRLDSAVSAHEFVSDGKTLWRVDHENREIDVRSLAGSSLPASAAFLLGGSLTKSYKVALDVSGTFGNGTVLALTPRTPSAEVKELELVVDPSDGHVLESIVIDSDGDVNHFTFDSVDTKTAPAATAFTVDPKAMTGYKVVKP